MVVMDISQSIHAIKEHVVSAAKGGVYEDTCLQEYSEQALDKTNRCEDQTIFADPGDEKNIYAGPSPLEHLRIAKDYLVELKKNSENYWKDAVSGDEESEFLLNRMNAVKTQGLAPESIYLAELLIYGGLAENAEEKSTKENYYKETISAFENLLIQENPAEDFIGVSIVEEILVPDIIFDKKVNAYQISEILNDLLSNFISVASENNKSLPRAEAYLSAIDIFLSANEEY